MLIGNSWRHHQRGFNRVLAGVNRTPGFHNILMSGNPGRANPGYVGTNTTRPAYSAGTRYRRGMSAMGSTFRGAWLADVLFTGALTVAGGFLGAAEWGAPTGLEEDYVGGFAYGATKDFGASVMASAGAYIGAGIGTAILPGAGSVVGALGGALAGSWGGYVAGSAMFEGPAMVLGEGTRMLSMTNSAVNRLHFGGGFQDTMEAYTMRQRAIQEMSGSLLNARQFLANEAVFLHER